MPDLENKSEQDARYPAGKAGQGIQSGADRGGPGGIEAVLRGRSRRGTIITTEPAQGEILKKGDTVKLILSKGKDIKPVTVLPFVGMSIDSALSQLESYKLTCDAADVEVVDSDKPGGTIVWQSTRPAARPCRSGRPSSSGSVRDWPAAALTQSRWTFPSTERTLSRWRSMWATSRIPSISETVYEADGAVSTTLYGTGRKMVKVYFDGVPGSEAIL